MRHGKLRRFFAVVAATMGIAGCGVDRATGPATPDGRLPEAPANGLLGEVLADLTSKDVLTRKVALAEDITVSKTIDRSGGTIAIPEAGFVLRIPPGAVNTAVTFSVTAVAGRAVAYEFAPHGITFSVPLVASQDLSGTDYRPLSLKVLSAAYFADRSQLDVASATALVSELIRGVTLPLSKQFYWPIQHFSGYIVAW
ncbi:MAG TPA: hypothetical protein VLE53_13130 [Gemmatimonadaceae bacterium]|nr:hypothetical protein [Gemmatimonadaceae bacterium]